MRIKVIEKCYTGTQGNMFAGEEHDLDDRIAEKLIQRGYVEAVTAKKAPKAKKKFFDRAVEADEIVTPEDE
jgi:hypothetical protein